MIADGVNDPEEEFLKRFSPPASVHSSASGPAPLPSGATPAELAGSKGVFGFTPRGLPAALSSVTAPAALAPVPTPGLLDLDLLFPLPRGFEVFVLFETRDGDGDDDCDASEAVTTGAPSSLLRGVLGVLAVLAFL